jgi:hypothetical protein
MPEGIEMTADSSYQTSASNEMRGAGALAPSGPPFGSKRAAALALYKPPFMFVHGYIFDADSRMVADQDGFQGGVETHIAARVRGWGRIGYMPDAEALQDEVGAVIAEALTEFWTARATAK